MWEHLKSWVWRALREQTFRDLGPCPNEGRYLIAGDSHAAGLARQWPQKDSDTIQLPVPVINAGVAGHNTREYHAYLTKKPFSGTAFSAALLWIGANDARADAHRNTAGVCLEYTKLIIGQLKEAAPRIFLLLPPDLQTEHSPFNTGSMEYLTNTIRPSLKAAAEDSDIEILDVDPLPIGPDGVHSTDEGYAALALRLADELRKKVTP